MGQWMSVLPVCPARLPIHEGHPLRSFTNPGVPTLSLFFPSSLGGWQQQAPPTQAQAPSSHSPNLCPLTSHLHGLLPPARWPDHHSSRPAASSLLHPHLQIPPSVGGSDSSWQLPLVTQATNLFEGLCCSLPAVTLFWPGSGPGPAYPFSPHPV